MKKTVLVILITLIFGVECIGQLKDEIIDKHYKAHNQSFWETTNTISIDGKWLSPKGYVPMKLLAKKPAYVVVFGKWKRKRFALAFDGKEAWTIAPWTDYQDVQLMTPEDELSIKHVMDFGSPIRSIVNLEYKGEVIENDASYHWFIEINSQYEIEYFIDSKTFLIHKMNKRERFGTAILSMTKLYEVYRDFGGVVFPSFVRVKTVSGESDYSFDSIIIGEGINSGIFLRSTHQKKQ